MKKKSSEPIEQQTPAYDCETVITIKNYANRCSAYKDVCRARLDHVGYRFWREMQVRAEDYLLDLVGDNYTT
jgi:hypothetical protein